MVHGTIAMGISMPCIRVPWVCLDMYTKPIYDPEIMVMAHVTVTMGIASLYACL